MNIDDKAVEITESTSDLVSKGIKAAQEFKHAVRALVASHLGSK